MGASRTIGKLGGKVLGGAYKAQSALFGTVPAGIVEGIGKAGGDKLAAGTGRVLKKALFKKGEANFSNGYTGYSATGLTNVLSTAGMVGVVGAVGAFSGAGSKVGVKGLPGFEGVQTMGQKVGAVSYGGAPTIMSADGVGTSTQAPNLGATGDLVFGLHSSRRG